MGFNEITMIRVLVVDDELRVRKGLRMQLELEPDLTVVGEAEDGLAAMMLATALKPDVVVMDLRMPGLDGFGATQNLRGLEHAPEVVVLSLHDDACSRALAAAAGAAQFVGKHEPGECLLLAIREAAGGRREPTGAPAR
jgi:DNA-binding NarL/FixJ family response regulator